MKPLVIFGDPEALVIAYLDAAFATRVETYRPLDISPFFPTVELAGRTHVQVELEVGNSDDYPITERAQVRVTCYADKNSRSNVKRLASLTQGLLYTHPGDSQVAGTSPLIGRSDVIKDPDTGNLMIWFTFRVSLLPTVLTA